MISIQITLPRLFPTIGFQIINENKIQTEDLPCLKAP